MIPKILDILAGTNTETDALRGELEDHFGERRSEAAQQAFVDAYQRDGMAVIKALLNTVEDWNTTIEWQASRPFLISPWRAVLHLIGGTRSHHDGLPIRFVELEALANLPTERNAEWLTAALLWLVEGDTEALAVARAGLSGKETARYEMDGDPTVHERLWLLEHGPVTDAAQAMLGVYGRGDCPYGAPRVGAELLARRAGITMDVPHAHRTLHGFMDHRAILMLAHAMDPAIFRVLAVTACKSPFIDPQHVAWLLHDLPCEDDIEVADGFDITRVWRQQTLVVSWSCRYPKKATLRAKGRISAKNHKTVAAAEKDVGRRLDKARKPASVLQDGGTALPAPLRDDLRPLLADAHRVGSECEALRWDLDQRGVA